MADDKIMIDDELDALTVGQKLVITFRAAKRAGIPVEWADGTSGQILWMDEDDLNAIDDPDHYKHDEFMAAWSHEARLFVATQMTARLVADGVIYVEGHNEDGEQMFRAVPGALVNEDEDDG